MESASEGTEPARVRWVVAALTVVVFVAVAVVLRALPPRSESITVGVLPTVNASLNGTAAACLVVGYVAVRRRALAVHRAAMLSAFGLSSAFLVTYLVHHAEVGSVRFQGPAELRMLYLAILLPHIALAGPVVPLALFTIYRGWTGRLDRHRKIARITLPIWLFVSVSGVVLYWMLYHLPR